MGKVFTEYEREDRRIPYTAGTLCFCLTQYAKDYIAENKVNKSSKNIRDAVLVDAINFLGAQGCCDFALYTKDLYDEKKYEEQVDGQCLLTVLLNHYAMYINIDINESVLRNKHMNRRRKPFSNELGAKIIVDFMNYISRRNDFDRIFTIQELNQRYEKYHYKMELDKLKVFLEKTDRYNQMFIKGETLGAIISGIAKKYKWSLISKNGIYYNDGKPVDIWTQKEIDEELYALAYSFQKLSDEKKLNLQNHVWNNAFDHKLTEIRTKSR